MFEEIKEKYSLNDDCIGELEKVVQSETDKVRTKYTTQIKELEQYKPHEKTEAEQEVENMRNELAQMKFEKSVTDAGFNADMAKYLKPDTDLNAFGEILKSLVPEQKKDFVAKGHNADSGLTKEQFKNMGYEQKAKLYAENPELYAQLNK